MTYLLTDVTLELYKEVIYEKVSKNKRPIANDKREEKCFVAFKIDKLCEKRSFLLSRFEIDKVRETRPFLLSRDFDLKKGLSFE